MIRVKKNVGSNINKIKLNTKLINGSVSLIIEDIDKLITLWRKLKIKTQNLITDNLILFSIRYPP